MEEKLRVDKWLWAVRVFKSRTVATDSCKASKVSIGDHVLKPSSLVHVGQTICIKKNGFSFQFKILKLISRRVSASQAILCYVNITPEEEMQKYNTWFIGKGSAEKRERGTGRPTKKERREIEEFKDDLLDWEDWE
ncbi:MAG TPA: S4 domain-containing protein [Saprospiraceae bacterium]|nr:S4 domain-containing protein [Saprospiraceae bacterium]